jgi:hypothetical protein
VFVSTESQDWDAMVDPLRRGQPAALIEWTRLATGFLVELRAYDFAEEWEDLLHRVLARLAAESPARHRAERGQARDRLRAITCDELSQDLRRLTQWHEARELPWCESALIVSSQTTLARPFDDEAIAAVKHELGNLPEQRYQVLNDVYGGGRNFDQVAAQRKLPLRMVKRFLRESLWELRERCAARLGGEAGEREDRVKSCFKTMDLDLSAFLVEARDEEWREFRSHYPTCVDCSSVLARWARLEVLVREACDGSEGHPSAQDLILLQHDGDGLGYSEYVAVMRHLDSCPSCGEAMNLLARREGGGLAPPLHDGRSTPVILDLSPSGQPGLVSRAAHRVRRLMGWDEDGSRD